jgi:RNA polymerase sigma factor (sigma-70 family)
MLQTQTSSLLRHVYRMAAAPEDAPETDRDLLRRFALQRDEAAFTTLVRRHGPMVLELGQRVLRNRHDAEDVLQATFLVLARKAGALTWHASIGPWLHEVACRLARKAKGAAARRCARLGRLQDRPAPEQAQDQGRQAVLDEELTRLPQKFRAPLVLCYLEGATRDEAAQQLACPLGTLKSRLERGRALLRGRLQRRGVTLSAGLLAAGLTQQAASSPARIASLVARAGVSPGAASLARQWLPGMMMSRLALTATVLLALAAFVARAGLLAPQSLAPPAPTRAVSKPQARADRHGDPLPNEAVARLGTLRFRHGGYIQSLAFLANGKRLIAQGGDGVRIWDVVTGKEVRQVCSATDGLGPTALAPDGKLIVVADGNSAGVLAVREAATGKVVRRFGKGTVNRVRLSANGKVLAAVCSPAVIELWDPATGSAIGTLEGHKDQIWSAAFSTDGKTLVSAGDDRTIRFWDVATGKEVRHFDCGEMVRQIALSPDGSLIATISHVKSVQSGITRWHPGNQVRICNASTGKELHILTMPAKDFPGNVRVGFLHLRFAPDGKTLVTGGLDRKLRVWDAATGKERRCFGDFSGTPSAFAFASGGKSLALVDGGSCIRVIDLASGEDRRPSTAIGPA